MKQLEPGEMREILVDFLTSNIAGAQDVEVTLSTEAVKAGFSAETVIFDAAYLQGGVRVVRGMVLRRQIFGHDLTFDADLLRPARAMQAMAAHSGLPVPVLVGVEMDHAVMGSPFLVMEQMPGRIVPQNPNYNVSGWLKELPPEARHQVWCRGIEAAARVHATDWSRGFEFLDLPERGALGLPQYLTWVEQWLGWALAGRSHPVAEAAMAYLRSNEPGNPPINVLWGDAIPANLLYDENNEVAGIIDWEYAALAPGEIDLGWWLYFDDLFSTGFGVPRLEGLPDRETAIATYEAALGRKVQDFEYYELIAGLRMTIVSIRAVDRVVAFGKIPADTDAWINNPSAAWVARRLGLPPVPVGPGFAAYIAAAFKH